MDNGPVRINDLVPNGRNVGGVNDPRRANLKANGKKKRGKLQRILIAVAGLAVVLGLAAGGWFYYKSTVASQIDGGEYQAVFLTNGQVYFGKLQMLSDGYMRLSNIFYLQAQSSSASSSSSLQSTSTNTSDVQLVKLGNEIHGPTDQMIVSKSQVLFFENLKNDGKVSSSIVKYLDTKK